MPYPRGIVTVLIIILIVIVSSELANGFMKLGSNHLLPEEHASNRNVSFYERKWIEQPLDHFNSSEKRTFKMTYLERLDFWKPNGPIYVYIGRDVWYDTVMIASDQFSIVCQMANDTNGALLATEQRYYGHSKPDIPNQNMTEYYKFLSYEQKLADIAYLIKSVKSDPKFKSSKVVVIGSWYEGNLAVWMRELYPDLVDAALAASAPVLAKKDFKEFYESVTYIYAKYGGEKCINDIETYFKRCEKLLQSSEGIEILKKEFNICPSNNLTILENQQSFFRYVLYADLVLYAVFVKPREIKVVCESYEPKDMFTMDLVKRARPVPLRRSCNDITFNSSDYTKPLFYLACTEYGHFQTTTSEKQPFVHWSPLDFHLKFCKGLFKGDIEKRIDEGVARTNKMYGGKHPNVTKVVFTHGDMDPWHTLGVLHDLGPDAPAIMINGTSMFAVLEVRPDDSEELKKNRKYVKELIKKWISTP